MKKTFNELLVCGIVIGLLFCARELNASVIINEFLADPGRGIIGDSNQDGVSSSTDEFVELFNAGDNDVDLSGWINTPGRR